MMDFNVLGMQEERSERLIRQFYLSKEISPKMVCSLFFSVQFLWCKQGNT